jgi:fused signal recognition particle receptor
MRLRTERQNSLKKGLPFMKLKTLAMPVISATLALSTFAAAEKKPQVPKAKPVKAQAEHNNAARNKNLNSEIRPNEERSKQLLQEEKELERQANEKNQQAKALIQQKKALHVQEISQEHQEKGTRNKSSRGALNGEIRHETAESEHLNQQIRQLEHEREELMRQVREKAAERKAIEARIRSEEPGRRK